MAESETGVKFLLLKDVRKHFKQFPDTFAISCNRTGGLNVFNENQEWIAILDFLDRTGELDFFNAEDIEEWNLTIDMRSFDSKRLYKYYCRACKRVTDWHITELLDGFEEHKCLVCGYIEIMP